jgi:nucleotidyltransferase/DNA polymerase involved in DNA repair
MAESRQIIHVYMDAFYASVEQLDKAFDEIRDKFGRNALRRGNMGDSR